MPVATYIDENELHSQRETFAMKRWLTLVMTLKGGEGVAVE